MRRLLVVGVLALVAAAVPAAATSVSRDAGPDQVYDATSRDGAVVTFDSTLTCNPPSGTFAIGTTPVTCNDGTTDTTFNVVVRDTAPEIAPPPVTVYDAASPDGATVSYDIPIAHDAVDGDVAANCTPLPGMLFALGSTDVTCTATDSAGNPATVTFPIQVVDRTPPVLTVPADITVPAASADGTPVANAAITAFLTAAVANDIVSGRVDVNSDAPAVLPVGTTVVTFTAADAAGNVGSATARVTVLEPDAPPPPPQPLVDRIPPDNVKNLAASAGNAVVRLTWSPPSAQDFDHVVVVRTTIDGAGATTVYTGRGTSYADQAVENDVGYRYTVVAYDRAGNRSAGAVASATPRVPLLVSPLDGGRVKKPPALVWRTFPDATYYNVQLFRGATKILSIWPKGTRYQLPRGWRYAGARYTLSAGAYRWYVWPGFGERKKARYGPLLGQSGFIVSR